MARPKPRSFGPSGQDKVPPGDPNKTPSASDGQRQGSGAGARSGKSKDADGRFAKLSKGDRAEPDGNPSSKDRGSGFSPTVDPPGSSKVSPLKPGLAAGAKAASKPVGKSRAQRAQGARPGNAARPKGSQVIPEAVAQRMLRRIAIATGVPSLLGMAVFVGSYLLVSRQIFDVPPVATLLASGACFLLGVVGLSYGVLSASWEEAPGTLLGSEQLAVNISRVRSSLRAMRQGGATPPPN